MIIPVRCFSCAKPIGHLYDRYKEKAQKGQGAKAMDEMGVERFCCRAQLLSHVDLIDTAARFKRH